MHSQHPAIAWTIAGSDSGGGAGVQADLKTFHNFGIHGCSVITALTAQNSMAVSHTHATPHNTLLAQINALDSDLPASAIKLGLLANASTVKSVARYLQNYCGFVVCDPVLKASSGHPLATAEITDLLRSDILPQVTLITPNRDEAALLLSRELTGISAIEMAAHDLLAMGPQSVLITGGHFEPVNGHRLDYWTDGNNSFWLSGPAIDTLHSHGSGCTLSSAITACLAKGYDMADALVLAKAYVTTGLRYAIQPGAGPGPVAHCKQPIALENLPTVHRHIPTERGPAFAHCDAPGLYPVVDSVEWIETLLPQGVKTIQLRIKDQPTSHIRQQIQRATELSRQYDAQLFINDYWQLAIDYGAYGVHLGQEDLAGADLTAIAKAGLRLGVSTHSYYEIARAHGIAPSYIAIGPIYNTATKAMTFAPQGLLQLREWVALLAPTYPLTAIGGISEERAADVLATGVGSCAMVSAITKAENVTAVVARLLALHSSQ